jgi:uncharacterized UPF0160 family protein
MEKMNLEQWLEDKFGMTMQGAKIKVRRGLIQGIVVTHDGPVFHADEVFACALLDVYREWMNNTKPFAYPPLLIHRGRGCTTHPDVLHIDVDQTFLDHHFPDDQKCYHDDGTPYASCGILWGIIGSDLVGEKYVDYIAKIIFNDIDAADNGVGTGNCQFSTMVSGFNSLWDDDSYDIMHNFEDAMAIAKRIINNSIAKIDAKMRANEIVQEAFDKSNGTIVKLPKYAPWQEVLIPSTAIYVYWRNVDGEWCCQAVAEEPMSFVTKCPFKAEWRGKSSDEIKALSGLDIKFVHPSGFYMVAETEEAVLEACRKSLEEAE